MAFAFNPKYIREENIDVFTSEQLLALCYEAMLALGWNVVLADQQALLAYSSTSVWKANEEVTIKINGNTVYVKSRSTGSEFFDMNRNKKRVKTFFEKINEIKNTKTADEWSAVYEDLKKGFTQESHNYFNEAEKSTSESFKDFFSLFIPNKQIFVTPVLIDLNILIFIVMLFYGAGFINSDNQVLITWGGNFRPLTVDSNEWWRLLTSTFLHAGVIHLLMNMYALLYIGVLLEPLLGKITFSVFYILTGIAASTTSLFWHDFSVCVGASGAIFGLYGIFLALLSTNVIHKSERTPLLMSIGFFVLYNLAFGIQGNTDNAAHIGGLLSGFIFGYMAYFIIQKKENTTVKISIVSGAVVATVICITLIMYTLPKNFLLYENKMAEFETNQTIAMEIYTNPQNDTTDIALQLANGIAAWKKCEQAIDTLEKLDLPIEYRTKNKHLLEYVELRIETYQMMQHPHPNLEADLASRYTKIENLVKKIDNE